MTAAPVLLVLLLLCVYEVGVGGAQDSPPSLSDVMKQVKVLRGMMVDMRGDNAVNAARCSCQKQLDTLQSNVSSRLSASEATMGGVIEKLQKHKDFELVKDDLAKLTARYGDLESSNHQLQTQFDQRTEQKDQLQSSNHQLQTQFDQLQSSNHQLQTQFDQLQSSNHQLQTQKDQLQSSNHQLQTQKDQLQSSNHQLQSSNHQLQTQFDQLQASYQQLNSRCHPVTENPEDRKRRQCGSDGFTWDGGVCYYLSTESKSWDESRRFCTARQADLIVINSQEKQDLLVRVVPSSTTVWIGLSNRDTEGSFKWVDGKPLSSPTFWYPGQPDNYGGVQDCVYYSNRGGSGRGWGDNPCSHPLLWMCERVVQ